MATQDQDQVAILQPQGALSQHQAPVERATRLQPQIRGQGPRYAPSASAVLKVANGLAGTKLSPALLLFFLRSDYPSVLVDPVSRAVDTRVRYAWLIGQKG